MPCPEYATVSLINLCFGRHNPQAIRIATIQAFKGCFSRFYIIAITMLTRIRACRREVILAGSTFFTIFIGATAGITAVIVIIMWRTFLGIKPARMSHPRSHIGAKFDNSILSHGGKRTLDRRRRIPTIRFVLQALPTNTIKLKVGISQAKAHILMSSIQITGRQGRQGKSI